MICVSNAFVVNFKADTVLIKQIYGDSLETCQKGDQSIGENHHYVSNW